MKRYRQLIGINPLLTDVKSAEILEIDPKLLGKWKASEQKQQKRKR